MLKKSLNIRQEKGLIPIFVMAMWHHDAHGAVYLWWALASQERRQFSLPLEARGFAIKRLTFCG